MIGGGLPVAAYGGKKEIMEKIAPLGGVYQAGTLSGNPLAMSAGIETIKVMNELELPGVYNLSNLKAGVDPSIFSKSYEQRINSVLGFGQFSYDNFLFLDFTASLIAARSATAGIPV